MKRLKNNKGISLITVTVTVLVLIIISSMIVYNAKNGAKIRKLTMMENDIDVLDDKINSYYLKYGAIPAEIKYLGETTAFDQPNDNNIYYVIDLKALGGISLNYGLDFDNVYSESDTLLYDDLYIINEQSHHIYYVQGIEIDGVMYNTNENDAKISMIIVGND